jgi:hypothetical protein
MYILYILSHMYENLTLDISESVKYEELIYYYLCSLLRIIEKWHSLISLLCMYDLSVLGSEYNHQAWDGILKLLRYSQSVPSAPRLFKNSNTEPECVTFKEPSDRFQGIDSSSLCSLCYNF